MAEDLIPSDLFMLLLLLNEMANVSSRAGTLVDAVIFLFIPMKLLMRLQHKAVNNALTLFDAIQPPAGEMPVVLGPGVTGILLHEAIGHGMEADFNRKKISTYSTMLGQKGG